MITIMNEEFNIEIGSYTIVGKNREARSGQGNRRCGTKPGAGESEFAGKLEAKHILLLSLHWG